MLQTLHNAFDDLLTGFRMSRVWIAFAGENIGDQHRRTTLGPFWLLLNYLAFVLTFILIFGHTTETYASYVAVGLLIWLYISETLTLSVSLFSRDESLIKGTRLPLSVYVLRLAAELATRAGYTLVGCIGIFIFAGTAPTAMWLWSLAGVALILITSPAVIMLGAFAGAFFPDLNFVVANVMRIGMFLTPIFWVPDGREGLRTTFYHWNPFTHYLEIVRMPIIEGVFPAVSFAVCIVLGVLFWMLAILVLGKLRRKVVFVL
jgi:lipopolysaccharide transport system permease protein